MLHLRLSALVVTISMLVMALPVAVANHGMYISSVSPTSVQAGGYVDVYGGGFDSVSEVYLGEYAGWSRYDDSHIRVTVPTIPSGTYTLQFFGGYECYDWDCYYTDTPYYSGIAVQNPDNDGDGWDFTSDCNENDWRINPGEHDTPYDLVDEDCDGSDARLADFFSHVDVYDQYRGTHEEFSFGVRDGASDGFEAGEDLPEPPAPPAGEYLRAFFEYPGNPEDARQLTTSVVDEGAVVVYNLTIAWTNSCCDHSFYLSWNPSAFYGLSSEFHVFMRDGASITDMRTASSMYLSYQTGSSSQKHVDIIVTMDGYQNLRVPYGWSLWSMPVIPQNNLTSDVFGSYVDAVYAWNGTAYVPASHVDPGVGYWVHNYYSEYYAPVVGRPIRFFDLPVNAGWNLVGAPYGGGDFTASGPVSPTTFFWNGNSYYSATHLTQGYGYWVYSHEASGVLHVGSGAAVRAPILPIPSQEAPGAEPYTMPFAVSDGSGASDGATIIAAAGGDAGFDDSDVVEAPRPLATVWTQAFIVTPGLPELDTSRVALGTAATHSLRIDRSGPAAHIVLSWDGAQLPANHIVEIVDGHTRVDMRHASSYTWHANAGASSKTLTIVVRPMGGPACVLALNDACLVETPFDPFRATLP